MTDKPVDACIPVDISDADVYAAMKDISGYLDITPGDFKELYVRAYQHAVRRLTQSIKAADAMTRDVASVRSDASLTEVAEIMARRGISGLPVIDAEGRPAGVISEKDFLVAMAGPEARTFMDVVMSCLKDRACLAAPVKILNAGQLMSSPAVTVNPDTPVMEVADILTQKKINRVPVVDKGGRMVGIVSRADVVRSSTLLEGK
jgi:CBS domain-containing membrane protein